VVAESPSPTDLTELGDPSRLALQLKTDDMRRRAGARPGAPRTEFYQDTPEVYYSRHTLRYVSDAPGFPPYEVVDLTYAMWYAFNGTKESHAADYEFVIVRLRGGKPTGVYFSNHNGGYWKPWDKVSKEAGRPRVFVAKESHAMCYLPGTHRRVLGFGNDYADADGVHAVPGIGYVLVDAADPARPWLAWRGMRDSMDGGPFMESIVNKGPDKGCAITDMPAVAASKLSPALRAVAFVGLLVAVLGLGFLSIRVQRTWLRIATVALTALTSTALGISWLVFTADVQAASLESTWWWL
jgi:hypothetical protein